LVLTKLIRLVVVLWVVTFLSFSMIKLIEVGGGGKNDDLVSKMIPFATPQVKDQLREDIGLQDPFLVQYWSWLSNFVTGDFGQHYIGSGEKVTGIPVSEQVSDRLPVSLELMLYAQVLALVIAIPFGVFTAYRSGTLFDRGANMGAFALLALPNFVVALLLAIYVGAQWQWLPTQSNLIPFPLSPVDNWRYMLMPTISLALAQIAIYMRLLRSDMIATLQEDFVTTAKAKGIPARRVLFRHALRPSSLTLLTVAGLNVGALIGGAVVVEVIFKVPGIGSALNEAILGRQYIEVQAYVAIIAIFYVVLNFAVDMLYSVLDPRIRHARAIA
jgi:peptide/nickel transport system permease protein